jgi:hypothetical protein
MRKEPAQGQAASRNMVIVHANKVVVGMQERGLKSRSMGEEDGGQDNPVGRYGGVLDWIDLLDLHQRVMTPYDSFEHGTHAP